MKHTNYINFTRLLRSTVTLLLFAAMTSAGFAQDRFDGLKRQLTQLADIQPGLHQPVNFSVNGASLPDFLRGISTAHNLNVSVNANVKGKVINNFSNARVIDVFIFLCRDHNLDITFTGSIMSFHDYVAPPEVIKPVLARKPKVSYNTSNDFLSLELKRDSLENVAEEITRLSFKNVIFAKELKGLPISVFIQNRPFDQTIDKMALANGLKVTKTKDNFYFIEKLVDPKKQTPGRNGTAGNAGGIGATNDNFTVDVIDERFITIDAQDVPIADIISEVSNQLHKNYFLFNEPEGNTSLHMENASFEEFLHYLLNGTEFTFKNQEEVFLIGKRTLEGLRTTELVQMENRTVETIIDFIPAELKKDVEIKEFIELNGLIVSGSYPKIEEIKVFLRQVDQVVPMVLVEIIIIDVNKSRSMQAGITAGLGGGTGTTSGNGGGGGINATMNASTVNSLINSFNGYGLVNLGNVTRDFYLSIQALETDEIVKVRSTPKLSTLNGHEATLKIGSTEYYAETTNTTIGSLDPSVISATIWKPINADLSVTIKPTVSSSEFVTLDLDVQQADFDPNSVPGQPRGTSTRSFQSTVRVKNGDMILLGGLEGKASGRAGSGIPFLSRIPVLKWFFGTRSMSKSKTQLNIFIKPTIIY